MGVLFDKLSFMKRLEDGGFARPHAEALHQAVSESVATKQDIGAVQQEIALLRSETKATVAETRAWTVGVGATIIAVLAGIKYFG